MFPDVRSSVTCRRTCARSKLVRLTTSPDLADGHCRALTAPGAPFEMEDVDVARRGAAGVEERPADAARACSTLSRAHGDAEFLVYDAEVPGAVAGPFDRLTFAAHARRRGRTFARRLIDDHGIQVGDRVAIAMRNFPEWSIAFWGAAAAGAVVVPLNAWWTGPELAYGLADSGSRVLVADRRAGRAHRRPPRRAAGPRATIVVGAGPDDRRRARVAFEDADRHVEPATPTLPDVDARPRGRRHDLLHVRHDGTAEGCARHAPQHLHEPGQPRLLRAQRGAAVGEPPPRPGAGAAATSTCCRCRSSTSPAATRCSSPTSPSAASS